MPTTLLSEEAKSQLRELHAKFHNAPDLKLTDFFRSGENRAAVDKRIPMSTGYSADEANQLLSAMRLYRGIALPLRHPNKPEGIAFRKHVLPLFGAIEKEVFSTSAGQLPPALDRP